MKRIWHKIKFNTNRELGWSGCSSKSKRNKACIKESDIKSIICGKLSKTITKKDLESLNAWDEVEDWFKKINELVSKVGKNVDND